MEPAALNKCSNWNAQYTSSIEHIIVLQGQRQDEKVNLSESNHQKKSPIYNNSLNKKINSDIEVIKIKMEVLYNFMDGAGCRHVKDYKNNKLT